MKPRALLLAAVIATLGNAGVQAAPAQAPSAPDTSERTQEVTVTANRIELEKRVSGFVSQIAAPENGAEGLARWEAPPVCPLVSGLSRQDGEFILERLSEIAHRAGVPLADEHRPPICTFW